MRRKMKKFEEALKVDRVKETFFYKELQYIMCGFGNDQYPYTDSVSIFLEDLVTEFISERSHKTMSSGRQGKVKIEDTVFFIQKDPRSFPELKTCLL